MCSLRDSIGMVLLRAKENPSLEMSQAVQHITQVIHAMDAALAGIVAGLLNALDIATLAKLQDTNLTNCNVDYKTSALMKQAFAADSQYLDKLKKQCILVKCCMKNTNLMTLLAQYGVDDDASISWAAYGKDLTAAIIRKSAAAGAAAAAPANGLGV